MDAPISRRSFIGASAAVSAAGMNAVARAGAAPRRYQQGRSPWPISLDTAVIRPATLHEKIEAAAAAGFDGVEPWEGELTEYEEEGGDLEELGARIADEGLTVPNVVALWNAIPENDEAWRELEDTHRRRFEQAAKVGAAHIQAVASPARAWDEFDLGWAAERYRDLLDMGREYGVIPALNFLQFFPHLQRLGTAVAIALDADHPDACIVPDTFHMYVGGSSWKALRRLQPELIAVFQINDAPGEPARTELEDEHRVYPGLGVLPLQDVLRDLQAIGYEGGVSLQLFNREYWEEEPKTAARWGLEHTLEVIETALS